MRRVRSARSSRAFDFNSRPLDSPPRSANKPCADYTAEYFYEFMKSGVEVANVHGTHSHRLVRSASVPTQRGRDEARAEGQGG